MFEQISLEAYFTQADSIAMSFKESDFTLPDVYKKYPDKPQTTLRARIYDNLGVKFERVGRGVYHVIEKGVSCVLLEQDGRDLSFLQDASVDFIITDHPWDDKASNKGGNRDFAEYDCFEYTQKDFDEKIRVLKNGAFLVEIIPEENSNNFDYLYRIKNMAIKAGFSYYSKVPWEKGTFISNTGRKAKNTQDVMLFTKGPARKMRIDVKRSTVDKTVFMSGTNGMLPTKFCAQPPSRTEKVHPSEIPVQLFEDIISFISTEGELGIDQFAGSGNMGRACLNKKRNCILIEQSKEYIKGIKERLNMVEYVPA